ncbi:YNL331Cp-like protein, partial [Lactarius sanguifluus]
LAPRRPASRRVSPLQLGTMSIGDQWQEFGMGSMNKTDSIMLLDTHFDAGISGRRHDLICSNYCQDESPEAFIGEWVEKRGIRDQLVLATKYSINYKRTLKSHMVTYSGSNTMSLHLSVDASLKTLRTTYIDILYAHWRDYTTSVEGVVSLSIRASRTALLYV